MAFALISAAAVIIGCDTARLLFTAGAEEGIRDMFMSIRLRWLIFFLPDCHKVSSYLPSFSAVC